MVIAVCCIVFHSNDNKKCWQFWPPCNSPLTPPSDFVAEHCKSLCNWRPLWNVMIGDMWVWTNSHRGKAHVIWNRKIHVISNILVITVQSSISTGFITAGCDFCLYSHCYIVLRVGHMIFFFYCCRWWHKNIGTVGRVYHYAGY